MTTEEVSPLPPTPGGDGGATAVEPAPKHRMIITRMELENFKSYAGLQSIGPFHKV